MVHFPFADPRKPVKLPVHLYPLSLARIAWSRLVPMGWTFRVAACVCRLDRRFRPKRRRQMVGLLEPFVPAGTSQRELERQVALSRMVRRMGARTYAPVFRRTRDLLQRE